jgi:hypothetical protein
MAVELISKTAYARLRGCDEKAVRKAVAEGRISLINGKIDPAVADIQWARNTRARASQAAPSANPAQAEIGNSTEPTAPAAAAPGANVATEKAATDPSYMQFRMRREEADAQIAEMNAAKMRGAMLMRDDVDRAMFEVGRELRDTLTACARRIASEVASMTAAEACEEVIDREHRIALQLLVTSCREKLGASMSGTAS